MSSSAIYGAGVRLSPRNLAVPFERAAALPPDETYALTRRSRPRLVQVVSHSKRRSRFVKFDPEYDALMRTSPLSNHVPTEHLDDVRVIVGEVITIVGDKYLSGTWEIGATCQHRTAGKGSDVCGAPTWLKAVRTGDDEHADVTVVPIPAHDGAPCPSYTEGKSCESTHDYTLQFSARQVYDLAGTDLRLCPHTMPPPVGKPPRTWVKGRAVKAPTTPRKVPQEYLDALAEVCPEREWSDLSTRQREAVRLYVEQRAAGLVKA